MTNFSYVLRCFFSLLSCFTSSQKKHWSYLTGTHSPVPFLHPIKQSQAWVLGYLSVHLDLEKYQNVRNKFLTSSKLPGFAVPQTSLAPVSSAVIPAAAFGHTLHTVGIAAAPEAPSTLQGGAHCNWGWGDCLGGLACPRGAGFGFTLRKMTLGTAKVEKQLWRRSPSVKEKRSCAHLGPVGSAEHIRWVASPHGIFCW